MSEKKTNSMLHAWQDVFQWTRNWKIVNAQLTEQRTKVGGFFLLMSPPRTLNNVRLAHFKKKFFKKILLITIFKKIRTNLLQFLYYFSMFWLFWTSMGSLKGQRSILIGKLMTRRTEFVTFKKLHKNMIINNYITFRTYC